MPPTSSPSHRGTPAIPTIGLFERAPHRAVEACVTESEDATVGGDQPIPPAIGGRRHSYDGLVQVKRTGRAVEDSATEGEHPTI